jgi:hypothetical protein
MNVSVSRRIEGPGLNNCRISVISKKLVIEPLDKVFYEEFEKMVLDDLFASDRDNRYNLLKHRRRCQPL